MTVANSLRLERQADGLAWLWIDQPDRITNTLSPGLLAELEGVLQALAPMPPRGLVIASAKAAGFIAGADIRVLAGLESGAAARDLAARGWAVFQRLAAAPYPTLALIRGHCLGGGLELALACRYRIVVDEPGTRLALPEVLLGIIPGWGGMARLPALIGPAQALNLMLTGKGVDARRAKGLGLADACVPPRVMENAARILVVSGQPARRLPWFQRLANGPLKALVARQAGRQLAARVRREHYPAPYAILATWARFGGDPRAVPPASPASLESLLAHPATASLMRVFLLQERLKGLAKAVDFAPAHVHVVGAGVMGGDIAALCAGAGLRVTLQDQSIERIAPAIARAARGFQRKFRGDDRQIRLALDRLIPDPAGLGAGRADVIIEAIVEDLAAKQALFAELERRARPQALLATNTSSLGLGQIAAALADPARLVGLHFFNPVALMPLVEVVGGPATDPALLACSLAFVRRLDKLPLAVADSPGFLVNAVLAPYLLEALRCVEEGLAPEAVDAALVAFGMPVGPVELADTIGLDVALAAGRVLGGAAEPPRLLQERVAAGLLGKKSGQGFYRWEGGRRVGQVHPEMGSAAARADLARRIINPLITATERCVAQGVVADGDLADAGVIFGAGFAPFTGGPLHFKARGGVSTP